MTFWVILLLALIVGWIAGVIASITGFGIGSLLTPLLGLQFDIKKAVAIVSVPHMIGTAVRMWILRSHVDTRLLWSFGAMSAAGGIVGALLHWRLRGPFLSIVLGTLLFAVGLMELSGMSRRIQFRGWMKWAAGALSGLLGGLVGNQGGIRSGAMLGFKVPKEAFVATATAVGLIVDCARVPVYFVTHGKFILQAWPFLITATIGVIGGTMMGQRMLKRISEATFRRIVAFVLLALGVWLAASGLLSDK